MYTGTFLRLISGISTFKVGNHFFVKIHANLEPLQPKILFNGKKTAFLRKFSSERVKRHWNTRCEMRQQSQMNGTVRTFGACCENVHFPAQAEYSYFSADFRLKIFLYYS